MYPLLLIITTIGFIIFYKLSVIIYSHCIIRRKLSCIPGPVSYPFFGTPQLRLKIEDRSLWYLTLLNKFKDGIFIIWVGHRPLVYLFKPELLHIILSSTVHIDKGQYYNITKSWLGDGILTASGKIWHKDRKLITPAFHFDILEQFAITMSEKTENMIKRLEKKIQENPAKAVDIISFIQRATSDIIQETAMGVNIGDEETVYMKTLTRYFELFSQRSNRSWLWIDWIYNLLPQGRECKSLVDTLHETTNEVLRKKLLVRNMQNAKAQNELDDPNVLCKPKRKAFLDLLLDINEKENAPLTNEQLRTQVHTIMFAGQDTTASAVTWTLFCIGNNLECQEKIHEELREVFKDSQRPATVKELLQLKYLERVIKEARRLYTVVPIITRKLMEDVKLDDYLIPKGTTIGIPIALVHRNPAIWTNPLKFDPDRFLPENMKNLNPYAYIPFSAGPRNCLGQKFAILEEKTLLTAILRKWRVTSMQKPEEINLMFTVVSRPNPGNINLCFKPKI